MCTGGADGDRENGELVAKADAERDGRVQSRLAPFIPEGGDPGVLMEDISSAVVGLGTERVQLDPKCEGRVTQIAERLRLRQRVVLLWANTCVLGRVSSLSVPANQRGQASDQGIPLVLLSDSSMVTLSARCQGERTKKSREPAGTNLNAKGGLFSSC